MALEEEFEQHTYRHVPRQGELARQGARTHVHSDTDLTELLQELRVLLPGTQVLVAFLIILPFTAVFAQLTIIQRIAYLATFVSAISSLILLQTPAAYHRVVRPLRNRIWFKAWASRLMVLALIPLGISISLSSYLIGAVVLNDWFGLALAIVFAAGMFLLWWLLPTHHKQSGLTS